MNSKPTYVFSCAETAIEIGRQIDRDKNNYLDRDKNNYKKMILVRHMSTLMEMKK